MSGEWDMDPKENKSRYTPEFNQATCSSGRNPDILKN